MAMEQLLIHLSHRLLGVSPRAIGVLFRWKISFVDRFQHQIAAVMQTRSRTVEMPNGLSLPLDFGMNTLLMGPVGKSLP